MLLRIRLAATTGAGCDPTRPRSGDRNSPTPSPRLLEGFEAGANGSQQRPSRRAQPRAGPARAPGEASRSLARRRRRWCSRGTGRDLDAPRTSSSRRIREAAQVSLRPGHRDLSVGLEASILARRHAMTAAGSVFLHRRLLLDRLAGRPNAPSSAPARCAAPVASPPACPHPLSAIDVLVAASRSLVGQRGRVDRTPAQALHPSRVRRYDTRPARPPAKPRAAGREARHRGLGDGGPSRQEDRLTSSPSLKDPVSIRPSTSRITWRRSHGPHTTSTRERCCSSGSSRAWSAAPAQTI